ncbi:hypothetical protein E4J66_07440 [Actinomyces viscosus]|uniref:Uncharacterized protein n=1 Tax=Actinomyces viscosus TaxID=1656 RepID=A0A448PMU1_ACTVI|nr:hypothetical protein [Actinomyces viscosus]TFH52467.1 hypothetical protein E4J66_07440 [Actinomyces viscosus]VEI17225.1 Uncharacterised protein [Actinomyces viscosus]
MGNDLVTEVKDSENIWTGSRLLEDGFDLKEAFESKSWVAGGLAVAATTADAVSAAMDPLGEAMSAGVTWVIEHLGSLNKWLNELTGDSDAVAAAASTWTNIATKLNSCADDLETVCTGRLAGQESLAVATFKSLQAGSASHLRMTGGVAGAISGGLTVASVIVRMVHDLVRDAISDVIGKLLSKATITVITAGLAAPWVVQSVISDVASWVTRLSKDIASTVLSAKNLKNLLDKATTLLDDVAAAFARIPAKASEAVTKKVEAAKDLASSLGPQHALAGAPGMTMAQARQAGKASPTVHTPKTPKSTKPTRPNPNEGRWGVKLDEAPAKSDPKPTTGGGEGTPPKGSGNGKGGGGSDPMSGPVVFYPRKNATEAEMKEYQEYVAGCNRALEAGALSKTGRVPTTGTALADEAARAARQERTAHPELYSDGKVAGHVPDSTWMGTAEPYEWQPMSRKVNSSLGGQNKRYPVGFKPTIFLRGERE